MKRKICIFLLNDNRFTHREKQQNQRKKARKKIREKKCSLIQIKNTKANINESIEAFVDVITLQSLFITSWIFFSSLCYLLFALRCHCQGFIIWRNVCVYVNKRSKFSIHTLYSGSSNSAVLLFIVELHASIVTPFP